MSTERDYEELAATVRRIKADALFIAGVPDGDELTPQVEEVIRAFLALDDDQRREVLSLWLDVVWRES